MFYSLFGDIPRVFMPLIWFEQKVRITPELASGLLWIPRILLGGQIFAGVCFTVGLILIFWYPIEHLISGRRRSRSHDFKPTSDAASKKVIVAGSGDVKLQKSAAVCENDKTAAHSPLLKKSSIPDGTAILNSTINKGHNDSIRTTCTTINVATE